MPGSYIPAIPVIVSFNSSQSMGSFTPSQTQQLQFITDTTNPLYLRHMNLTQDGLYMQIGTGSVFISKANLYGVGSQALALLNWPPVIVLQPTSSIVAHTSSVFFTTSASVAQYTPNATVQWYSSSFSQSLVGSSSLLINSPVFSGSTSSNLTCSKTDVGMDNSQFYCVYSNTSGQTTSSLALLNVT